MLGQITLGEVPRISAEEAKAFADSGDAIFVDVRKPEYYQRLRIDGATSIPLKGPADRFWQLPRDRVVII